MSEEYVTRVNAKRKELGFKELSSGGKAEDSWKTLEYCKKLILSELEFKKNCF